MTKIFFILIFTTISLLASNVVDSNPVNDMQMLFINFFNSTFYNIFIAVMFILATMYLLKNRTLLIFLVPMCFLLLQITFKELFILPEEQNSISLNTLSCASGYILKDDKCYLDINKESNLNLDTKKEHNVNLDTKKEPNVNIVNNGTANINFNTYNGPVTIIQNQQ